MFFDGTQRIRCRHGAVLPRIARENQAATVGPDDPNQLGELLGADLASFIDDDDRATLELVRREKMLKRIGWQTICLQSLHLLTLRSQDHDRVFGFRQAALDLLECETFPRPCPAVK